MRLTSTAARVAAVTVAGALGLAGCSNGQADPGPSAKNSGRATAGAVSARRIAALRAGLRNPSGRGPVYYLSLGDSLARGIQPSSSGADVATRRGYPDQLAALIRPGLPGLRLVKLGCPGETTTTMVHGGICRYPAGSQLRQATRFLRAHRGRTALVTIDIGANDVNSCVLGQPPPTILTCLIGRIGQTRHNLDVILSALRAAGGRRLLIVGMTYYVPELGLWYQGRRGRQIALVTADFVAGANKFIATAYRRYRARVADTYGAFRSVDFGTVLKHGKRGSGRLPARPVPPNVHAICRLTWMCAAPPRGPNEHANAAGYALIARTFWRAIGAPAGPG
ncbi:MAG TPA: SGNH/GDSL hydrolase family protein [Streptosporangiaceae bacterium]